MTDFPPDTICIEIRGVYDGVSAYLLPDGTYVNRWKPEDGRRYTATEDWIARAREAGA